MQLTEQVTFRYLLIVFAFSTTADSFAQKATQEIRVMSYNIRYLNKIDSLNGWQYRKDNVASLVKYHQADLLGVQEAVLQQIGDLTERLPGFKWYGVPRVSGASGEYTAIFYRQDKFKLLDSGTFWFSETPYIKESKSWDAMFPRIASWCKFRDKKSGVEFYFFNTHFDHMGEIARQKSSEILSHQIDSIAKNLAVIVTGDFNATPTSVAYKKILEPGKLKDALDISSTPHYGPVNTSSGFSVSDKPIRNRIDYIFVNKKVKVLQHVTITDQQEARYYSDHLPVLAVISISR
jgi:endonuclease/exonuclease/phosphatase family metal-dependent hydrolase